MGNIWGIYREYIGNIWGIWIPQVPSFYRSLHYWIFGLESHQLWWIPHGCWLVVEPYPFEKYKFLNWDYCHQYIPIIYMEKKCFKPPNSFDSPCKVTPLFRQLVVEPQHIFNTNHEQSSCSLRFQASWRVASLEGNSLLNFVRISSWKLLMTWSWGSSSV